LKRAWAILLLQFVTKNEIFSNSFCFFHFGHKKKPVSDYRIRIRIDLKCWIHILIEINANRKQCIQSVELTQMPREMLMRTILPESVETTQYWTRSVDSHHTTPEGLLHVQSSQGGINDNSSAFTAQKSFDGHCIV